MVKAGVFWNAGNHAGCPTSWSGRPGAIASAGDFTVKVQESPTSTDGDFTDVVAADLAGNTLPATLAADSSYKVSYIGSKRYARVVATKNGGTSIAAGAVAILGNAADKPVA